MNKLKTRLMVIISTFAIGISAAAGWIYFRTPSSPHVILPKSSWEPIFFNSGKPGCGISQATQMANLKELRKTVLPEGDAEVRVWRGFGLSELEAIILKSSNGDWSAFHLKTDCEENSFEKVELKSLNAPHSGWDSFWKQVSDKGLLELPDQSEIGCDILGYDGMHYVVEINRNLIYRTYWYTSGNDKCEEAKRMDEIGEMIGLEFDSGNELCKTTEWFACMTYLRKLKQKNK